MSNLKTKMSEPKRSKEMKIEGDEDGKGSLPLKGQATISSAGEGVLALAPNRNSGFRVDMVPPEMWELIFKNVGSSKDLLSCWNTASANSTWRKALQRTDFRFKMTLPLILPYLDKNDILNCSSVSKFWNGAVDAYIQEAEDFGSNSRLKQNQQIKLRQYSNDMIGFMEEFRLPTNNDFPVVNPVPFRRVKISLWSSILMLDGPEEEEERVQFAADSSNIFKCFDYYGYLIRNLTLSFSNDTISHFDKIKLIKSCVDRTPNLRVINISASASEIEENLHGNSKILKMRTKAFNDFMSENPWPILEHLKVLKFSCNSDRKELSSLTNAYGPQLVYLQFGFPCSLAPYRLDPGRFSCLQKIVYFFSPSNNGSEFGKFVRSSQCPLKQLIVEFCNEPLVGHYNALIMAANAASSTLETLVFHSEFVMVDRKINHDILKFEKLRLPMLKKFVLKRFSYPSLQFLQSVCPALQQLVVHPTCPLGNHIGWEVLEDRKMYQDLYSEHQFWNQLADIENVDVENVFHPKYVFVDGKRRGEQIRKKLNVRKERKSYSRQGYEAEKGGDIPM